MSMLDLYQMQGLQLLPVADPPVANTAQSRSAAAHEKFRQPPDHAYNFGYNNPQFSDKILHVMRERKPCSDHQEGRPLQSHSPLLSMHVNSLTLAANSEVFR